MKTDTPLSIKYKPSNPCSCEICTNFCKRPGWWTVAEAEKAIRAGFSHRMMLEISPEKTFGVVSPAFAGCEKNFALQEYSTNGCNFLKNKLCELHGSMYQPLECRFCHHERRRSGISCHSDIAKEWNSRDGFELIDEWINEVDFRYYSHYYELIAKNTPRLFSTQSM
jgi:hypothetical protein